MRIAIDLMGSDSAPEVLFQGVRQASQELQGVDTFYVIATPDVITHLKKYKLSPLIEFIPSPTFIKMEDSPMLAIRRKRDASLMIGLNLVKEGKVEAFISAGNTGALILGAWTILDHHPQMDRPALLAVLPTRKAPLAVIDVGGNLSCDAEHLVQFGLIGAAYQRKVLGKTKPRIGLLNIGNESKKGTKVLREAYQLLMERKKESYEFMGNIEGKEVFNGDVDVLVAEGFTGNIFLKTTEGVSHFFLEALKKASADSSKPISPAMLQAMEKQFSYDEYPGAILCGVEELVIKCHGDTSKKTMFQGIKGAVETAQLGGFKFSIER